MIVSKIEKLKKRGGWINMKYLEKNAQNHGLNTFSWHMGSLDQISTLCGNPDQPIYCIYACLYIYISFYHLVR